MLRLLVHVKDGYFKVRQLLPHEQLASPLQWQGLLEFEYTEESRYMISWPSFIPDLEPQYARAVVDLVASRYPVSQKYQELRALCPAMAFDDKAPEWVFYGGSFNPWHMGHQTCIELLPADKTCFILPDINPHKEERDFELVSTVLELSARARFRDHQFLVPSFLIQKTKNPTVEWIERIHRDFPDRKLSLLMGFDSFAGITGWTRASDLIKNLHCLYVVSRLERPEARDVAIQKVLILRPDIKLEFLGGHEFEDISSTALRKPL